MDEVTRWTRDEVEEVDKMDYVGLIKISQPLDVM